LAACRPREQQSAEQQQGISQGGGGSNYRYLHAARLLPQRDTRTWRRRTTVRLAAEFAVVALSTKANEADVKLVEYFFNLQKEREKKNHGLLGKGWRNC
jgi:hypothetical protein